LARCHNTKGDLLTLLARHRLFFRQVTTRMIDPRGTAVNDRSSTAVPPAAPAGPLGSSASSAGRRPDRQLGDRVRSLSLGRMPERRSNLVLTTVWILGIIAAAGGAWYGYTHYLAPKAAEEQSANVATEKSPTNPQARTAAPPSTTTSARQEHPTSSSASAAPPKGDVVLEAKGYIVPAHQILVSPKVNGMIVQLNVEEGRRVTKGDILAILESIDYAADCERAKANVRLMRERLRELENGSRPEEIKEAEADLQEAEALLPQLEAEYKRTAELRRRSSATQQEFELAESKYLAQIQRGQKLKYALKLMQLGPRQERIDVARAELAQAEADVVKAEWRLGNCTIRAPITGTILKKNAEEGNIVNPIAFNGSYSLCDMADLSDLEVDLNIQERDISVVKVGQKCRVRAEAYQERIYEGYVDRLMPIADRAKGAIPVRVKIRIPADEEGVYLKPEMGAIVTFLHEQVTPPTTAATSDATAAEVTPVSTVP
jgi:HlyD family secretion protein